MAHRGRSNGGHELQLLQGPKLTLMEGIVAKEAIPQIINTPLGRQISHGPHLTESDKVNLILTAISRSFLQAQRIAVSAGDPTTSTSLYLISCRACAEAILDAILTFRYPLNRNILKTVNIVPCDQRTYDYFDNMMTEIQAAMEDESANKATIPMSISPGLSIDPIAGANRASSVVTESLKEFQLPQGRMLRLKKGDIARENVDVIVNAANSHLAHGGGVAGALNRASNGILQIHSNQYIRQHGQLPVGEACVTPGGGLLNCRFVVHAVGPMASPTLSDHEAAYLISSAIRNSLWEAEKLGAGSIAIPAISCGIFGINRELSAGAILDAILYYNFPMDANILSDMSIVINDQPTYACFAQVLTQKWAGLRTRKEANGGFQQPLPHQPGSNIAATYLQSYVPLSPGTFQQLLPHQLGLDVAATSSTPYVPLIPGGFQQPLPNQLSSNVATTSSKLYVPLMPGSFQQPLPHHVVSSTRTDPAAAGDANAAASPGSVAKVSAKPFVVPSSSAATDANVSMTLQTFKRKTGNSDEEFFAGAGTSTKGMTKRPREKPEDSSYDSTGSPAKVPACYTCLKKNPVNKVKMGCCQQILCKACHTRIFRASPYCPLCPKVKKAIIKNQPMDATMDFLVSLDSLPDYQGLGTIVIAYHVPDGIQTQEHPNPGDRYHGISRTAYLPNSVEGREVLQLLHRAFKARLIFTVSNDRTSGKTNVVTWNGISHKTSISQGEYGWPDPTYFDRVKQELKEKGIY